MRVIVVVVIIIIISSDDERIHKNDLVPCLLNHSHIIAQCSHAFFPWNKIDPILIHKSLPPGILEYSKSGRIQILSHTDAGTFT